MWLGLRRSDLHVLLSASFPPCSSVLRPPTIGNGGQLITVMVAIVSLPQHCPFVARPTTHASRCQPVRCATKPEVPAAFARTVSDQPRTSSEGPQGQPSQGAALPVVDEARRADVLKGCRTVLKELQGLDFPQAEVRLYFQAANKLPKGFGGQTADMARARTALDLLLKQVDEEGDPLPARGFPDLPGLLLTQAVLSDLWRWVSLWQLQPRVSSQEVPGWRRKGGGMDYTESEQRPHQVRGDAAGLKRRRRGSRAGAAERLKQQKQGQRGWGRGQQQQQQQGQRGWDRGQQQQQQQQGQRKQQKQLEWELGQQGQQGQRDSVRNHTVAGFKVLQGLGKGDRAVARLPAAAALLPPRSSWLLLLTVQAALEDIQEFKPEDMDRIQSSLLDNLPISDKDKAAMSGTMQQLSTTDPAIMWHSTAPDLILAAVSQGNVHGPAHGADSQLPSTARDRVQAAVGAFNGAVWGSLVASLAFLAYFNFFRGG
ncbi:hypothetical protein QJQ45_022577 [Haematococcus lacustris]|nr:hypothetical protein QJQ45_022577 [Haematococcus lacustris]